MVLPESLQCRELVEGEPVNQPEVTPLQFESLEVRQGRKLIVLEHTERVTTQDQELEPLVMDKGALVELAQVVVGQIQLDQDAHVLEGVPVDFLDAGAPHEDPLQVQQVRPLEGPRGKFGDAISRELDNLGVRVEGVGKLEEARARAQGRLFSRGPSAPARERAVGPGVDPTVPAAARETLDHEEQTDQHASARPVDQMALPQAHLPEL